MLYYSKSHSLSRPIKFLLTSAQSERARERENYITTIDSGARACKEELGHKS